MTKIAVRDRAPVRAARPNRAKNARAPRQRTNAAAFSLVGGFALGLAVLTAFERAPVWVSVVYTVSSGITLLVYRFDKSAAQSGRRRVPEARLHLLELCCGWPGALLAQRLFRHKTQKQPFQWIFWCAVVFNNLALSAVLYRVNAMDWLPLG